MLTDLEEPASRADGRVDSVVAIGVLRQGEAEVGRIPLALWPSVERDDPACGERHEDEPLADAKRFPRPEAVAVEAGGALGVGDVKVDVVEHEALQPPM